MSSFSSDSPYPNDSPKDNLIVNYLPLEMSENDLQTLFEQFGTITHLKIIRDRETKRSLGYGFVKFESETEATNAMQHLNGYRIGKKQIKVSVARPSSTNIKECKIYVSNLPPEYGRQEVVNLFSRYGNIIECRLLYDVQTGQSRSTAFVQFDTKQEAINALALNGTILENSSRQLLVKFAEDHANKRFQEQNLMNSPHRVQQQLYFDNMMMGKGRPYDQRRGNNQQQQVGFDMYRFYSGNEMPWLGISPYYNYELTPTDQSQSNQVNHNMNNNPNNSQMSSQFHG